ncbi:MAG: hypothetical protein QOH28_808 [Actinomycetota bacterium]|jgi:hypothetical protein|nr:hypothetical protein [Actinomycetota bacterium]
MHFAAVAMLLRAFTLRAGGATDRVPAQSRYEATADHPKVESVRTTRDALDGVGLNIGDEPPVVATRRAGHHELGTFTGSGGPAPSSHQLCVRPIASPEQSSC